MPTRTPPVAAWTPSYVAAAVAAALELAAGHSLPRAVGEVARQLCLSPATVHEWVSRARAVQAAPVPPDLLVCRTCEQPMILISLPNCQPVYLCAPSCGRAPVPAEALRAAVAAAVLHRTPHLVPVGKAPHAASYAPGPIQRIAVGATPHDLHITWRPVPRQVAGPLMAMAQRLHQAQRHADSGARARAIDTLHSGLLHVDPAGDRLALDTATARAAALLAALTLAEGDPTDALLWARWAHRSLRHLLHDTTDPQVRTALKVLAAAHRSAGDLTASADCYSDLIRHHTQAEGPYALPTLAAQATLALVLHESGRCEQAHQLLTRTIADQRRAHPLHPGASRMAAALQRLRQTCTEECHRSQPGHDVQ